MPNRIGLPTGYQSQLTAELLVPLRVSVLPEIAKGVEQPVAERRIEPLVIDLAQGVDRGPEHPWVFTMRCALWQTV